MQGLAMSGPSRLARARLAGGGGWRPGRLTVALCTLGALLAGHLVLTRWLLGGGGDEVVVDRKQRGGGGRSGSDDWGGGGLGRRVCQAVAESYHRCKKRAHWPTAVEARSGRVKCRFNVNEDLSYLPSADLLRCVARIPPTSWADDAEAYQRRVTELQNPARCDQPASKEVHEPHFSVERAEAPFAKGTMVDKRVTHKGPAPVNELKPKWDLIGFLQHGWGYNLFVFALNAANHWAEGIPVIVGNSAYRFSDQSCGRGYSCELSPLSETCDVDSIPHDQISVFGPGAKVEDMMTLDQVCKPHGRYEKPFGRCNCDEGHLPAVGTDAFFCRPYGAFDFSITRKRLHREEYERRKRRAIEGVQPWFSLNAPLTANPHGTRVAYHQGYARDSDFARQGFFWAHAQALFWLLKDSRRKGQHNLVRRKLGLRDGRCLAVHVRHGDSCHDKYQNHRTCVPLSVYIAKARKMVKLYGKFDRVFLATDDPKVIKDAKKYQREFHIVFQPQDRSFYEDESDVGVDVRDDFNAEDKINEITSDIWLMAHCDAIIGSMASSVVWVAYEFMAANHGYYPPFISIDTPYGAAVNVGRFYNE